MRMIPAVLFLVVVPYFFGRGVAATLQPAGQPGAAVFAVLAAVAYAAGVVTIWGRLR